MCHRRPLELTGAWRWRASGHRYRRARGTCRGIPPIAIRCGQRTSTIVTAEQLTATNGVDPRDLYNSKGHRLWWGIPYDTLETVLEHIEVCNSPRFEYPPPPAFSCSRCSSWMPRRIKTASFSSSVSRSRSSVSPTLLPVKPEPQETGLVPIKQEHLDMATNDETALKWA
ncbi:Protein kinase APK1A, chloroplastic [Hordeum vulgare]|nr:Protein kinase APK1A, chloroplastic [Hordeum vulgare]